MPRTNPPYPNEYREEMVELVRGGESPEKLAKRFEPSSQTIRNWLAQSKIDESRKQDGRKKSETEELRQLRREVKHLQLERDILAKAAAWFARETGPIPSGSSNS